jgi:uridine kinase
MTDKTNHKQYMNLDILDMIAEDKKGANHVVTYRVNNQFIHGNSVIEEDSIIEPIYLNSIEGLRIYQDLIIFLLGMTIFRLYDNKETLFVEHSIGDGVFCSLRNKKVTEKIIDNINVGMKMLIDDALPIEKHTLPVDKAYEILHHLERNDVIKNLSFNNKRYIELYKSGDYYDYFPRPLPPYTSCAAKFELVELNNGFVVRFPKGKNSTIAKKFELPQLLFAQNQEHDKWLRILDAATVGDINRLINKKEMREFILTEEALHEKKIATLADNIKKKKTTKFVLIAGPSSSGKTTFAKRLAIQLKVNGAIPYVLGLDDYFLPRDKTPKLKNGEYDFENITALDLELINKDLSSLLKGEEITLPRYNFFTGDREVSNHKLKLGEENIVVIEGIHGLNELLTASIPAENKVKIYISALNQLNIDFHNRIPTTDCRRIRRIVRDAQFRGYTAEDTLKRWPSVREGEDKYIFPFQENADFMFNSYLTYELGVLRKYIMPLLRNIDYTSPVYNDAQDLIALIEHFLDIKDELVPNNSILREFIAASIFEY